MRFLIGVVLSVFLTSCVSPSRDAKKTLSFEQARKFASTGKNDSKQVENFFGSPSLKLDLDGGEQAWLYFDGNVRVTRLSIIFDKSGSTSGVNWFPREGEAETDLATMKNFFQKSQFEEKHPEGRSHYIPDQIYYVDARGGVELTYQRSSRKISSISWEGTSEPARAPSDTK